MSQLFKLKNGTVLLSTEAPGGVYNSGQLKKIAELCSKELAVVKATEDQRLALFVKESEVKNVVQQLQAMGLGVRNYQEGLHQPIACLGELCEDHEQPALSTAMDLTKAIASISLQSSLKIGINGCARCCTPCHTLDISILGEPSGYRISLGGKTSQFPELSSFFAEGVPAKELPRMIKNIIVLFQSKAEPGETLHSVLERCGAEEFVQILAPYSQDAAHRDDPFAASSPVSEEMDTVEALEAVEAESFESNESNESIESEDEISLDDDSATADEDSITLDFTADDDSLGEIRIDSSASAVLGDDISLDDSDHDLDRDLLLQEGPDAPAMGESMDGEDLDLEAAEASLLEEDMLEMDFEQQPMVEEKPETSAAEDLLMEDESFDLADPEPDFALDTAQMDDEAASLDEVSLEAEDEIEVADLDMDDLTLEESLEEEMPQAGDSAEEIDLVDQEDIIALADDAHEQDITLEFDDSDALDPGSEDLLELEQSEELDMLDAGVDLDPNLILESEEEILEESISLDDEGIPELDGGLAPDELQKTQAATQVAVNPASLIPEDTFDEELAFDSTELSDEEESSFEAKLQASIDEEARLLADVDHDPNVEDREAALSLLAKPAELRPLSLADTGKNAGKLKDKVQEAPSAAGKEAKAINAAPATPQKQKQSAQSQAAMAFKLAGLAFEAGHLRVTFVSGASIDLDLDSLEPYVERSLMLGAQQITVMQTDEGYTLEIDGMRMFYPATLQSAS